MLFNEKGQALFLVLLSITLLSVLATVIVSQAQTSSKQIKKTESHLKATDVAEMGVDYFVENVIKKVDFTKSGARKDACAFIYDVVNNEARVDQVDTYSTFELSYENACATANTFRFTSTGTVTINDTVTSETLTVSFPIDVNLNRDFPTRPPGYADCGGLNPCAITGDKQYGSDVYIPTGLDLNMDTTLTTHNNLYIYGKLFIKAKKNHMNPYVPSDFPSGHEYELWVKKDLYINGGAEINDDSAEIRNFGNLYVGGDLHINWGLDDRNHGDIIVDGDAYFYHKTINTKPNSFVCVKGTFYMPLQSDFSLINPLGGYSCEQLRQQGKVGIYANHKSDYFSNAEVTLSLDDLTIQY